MNEGNHEQPARTQHNQNLMHQCLVNDRDMRNKRCVNSIKYTNNIRIICLNVKELDPWKCKRWEDS